MEKKPKKDPFKDKKKKPEYERDPDPTGWWGDDTWGYESADPREVYLRYDEHSEYL